MGNKNCDKQPVYVWRDGEGGGGDSCVTVSCCAQGKFMVPPNPWEGEEKEVNMAPLHSETEEFQCQKMLETLFCAPLKVHMPSAFP